MTSGPERRAFSVAVYARRGERVLIIEHHRLKTWLPIGGELEPGETPLEAARRELREETGYTSEEWRRLGSFTVDGNYGLCTAHLFLAQGAIQSNAAGGHGHDDLEEIEVLSLPLADALAAVTGGGEPSRIASMNARSSWT